MAVAATYYSGAAQKGAFGHGWAAFCAGAPRTDSARRYPTRAGGMTAAWEAGWDAAGRAAAGPSETAPRHAVVYPDCPVPSEDHHFCSGCLRGVHVKVFPLCPSCTSTAAGDAADRERVFCTHAARTVTTAAVPNATAWLAPDGGFYLCRAGEHDAVGIMIANVKGYAGQRKHGDLTERGWVKVSESGYLVGGNGGRVTQAQYDVLFDIVSAWDGYNSDFVAGQFNALAVE
jgi:hypothetical protein